MQLINKIKTKLLRRFKAMSNYRVLKNMKRSIDKKIVDLKPGDLVDLPPACGKQLIDQGVVELNVEKPVQSVKPIVETVTQPIVEPVEVVQIVDSKGDKDNATKPNEQNDEFIKNDKQGNKSETGKNKGNKKQGKGKSS